jgi:hypothetical protein
MAAMPMNAATAIPAPERGRHSSAQNTANSRYQGTSIPLLATSMTAVGSSTTLAASTARSAGVRT